MKEGCLIRKATLNDLEGILELEKEAFSLPFNEEQMTYEFLANPVANIYVYLDEKKEIVGYIDFYITFDSATIARVAVKKNHRQQGIASKLMEKMLEVLRNQPEEVLFLTLEVRVSNLAAIKLYEKLGFEKVTVKKAYYENGEDAIYMMRGVNE
ncbi:MAG: ribosomal protein S18-alanine N-acetyltransferase [Bacilli bacterium]|nr:ribosomal protein S18-alanine N-acetyltransferase [Bacilli bacterium]